MMKIKTYLLATAIVASCATVSAQGEGTGVSSGSGNGLSMSFDRVSIASPIRTSILSGESVEANFTANMGTVKIEITNSRGVIIYRKDVNTLFENSLNVNISNFPADSYTIIYKNSKRETITGQSFYINR